MTVREIDGAFLESARQFPLYTVIFITRGNGMYYADIGKFAFKAPVLLFSTPLQKIFLAKDVLLTGYVIQFHGDFYCIEYHKARVSCNGLLFNNIYIEPSVNLTDTEEESFRSVCLDMLNEFTANEPDDVVMRSYLQLFLAKSSSVKLKAMAGPAAEKVKDEQMEAFMQLLETNFLTLHKPADYAERLTMTPNSLSKKALKYYGKSPSLMIQERLILEAKKKLHLTRQSIKEIAYALNFSDEFYFSRFFKKFTKVSPQAYREQAGISIVADMKA
ncbi:MAG: helix-turn-helix domain-containing protein [Bacteroidota bacterium]